jgi:hypothetical protein
MDLATIFIILGTFIGAVFFMMDKYIHNQTITTRKQLLYKFREVKGKSIKLYDDIQHLVSIYPEEYQSYYESSEYLDLIKEKIDIEYSDAEYLKLKKIKLTKAIIKEYSERFKYHQDALIALRNDYNRHLSGLALIEQAIS